MLKRKLTRNILASEGTSAVASVVGWRKKCLKSQVELLTQPEASDGRADSVSFWRRFFDLEFLLNEKLANLTIPATITHVYNPVEYAVELHQSYLQRFLDGRKRLLFVGMNPGPNGMGQTGVPFGNILTVRDEMQIRGSVAQPAHLHAKRPVLGLECAIEEPSGVRLWTLFKKLAGGSLDVFGRQCFVHNFCPLIFYDCKGRNITPSELKDDYKLKVRDTCLETLDRQIELLQPEVVVAIGEYINSTLKRSKHAKAVKMLKLPHPSPRSLNNQNWPEKAEQLVLQYDILKYIRNEAV